jgi:hypothetical protein
MRNVQMLVSGDWWEWYFCFVLASKGRKAIMQLPAGKYFG